MSNSFSVDVRPEIAAAVVKIDANKAVIDNIHDTDLPAVKTVVDSNDTIITDLHDTDLPAAKTVIDSNSTIITDIHDTDLPAVKSVVDTNNTVIDLIRGNQLYFSQASDVILATAATERTTYSVPYVKLKEIFIGFAGTFRVRCGLKTSFDSANAYYKIYKNGIAFGAEQMTLSETYVYFSEDLVFAANDLLQLYVHISNATYFASVIDLTVRGDIIIDILDVVTD